MDRVRQPLFFEIRAPDEGPQNGKLKLKKEAWLCQVLTLLNKKQEAP